MGCSKGSSVREILSNKCLPQETRNVSNELAEVYLYTSRNEKKKNKGPKLAEGKK